MKALRLAERATLGSLLLDPAAVDGIGGWLRAGDFADPWHAEVFRTLRELRAATADAGPAAVGRHLLARLGPTRADLPRIADLLRATPARPNPRAYAVMVFEAALRREIDGHGVLLRAGARAAAVESSARPMVAATATVDSLLDAAEARWNAATGRTDARATASMTSTRPPAMSALAADRYLRTHPQADADQAAEHEADLIACLINKPDHLGEISGWLRSAAIGGPTWRPVYEALLSLRQNGSPIDPISVLWEVQRSAPSLGRGPDPGALLARAEATGAASPAYLARIVAGEHLRIAADHAAGSLRSGAANPGVRIEDLFGTAHAFTSALRTGAAPLGVDRVAQRIASVHRFPPAHARRSGPVAG